jgi:hypothetical protein
MAKSKASIPGAVPALCSIDWSVGPNSAKPAISRWQSIRFENQLSECFQMSVHEFVSKSVSVALVISCDFSRHYKAQFIFTIVFSNERNLLQNTLSVGHDSWDIVLTISSLVAILRLLANGRGCASLFTATIGDCSQGTFMIVLRNDRIPKGNRV